MADADRVALTRRTIHLFRDMPVDPDLRGESRVYDSADSFVLRRVGTLRGPLLREALAARGLRALRAPKPLWGARRLRTGGPAIKTGGPSAAAGSRDLPWLRARGHLTSPTCLTAARMRHVSHRRKATLHRGPLSMVAFAKNATYTRPRGLGAFLRHRIVDAGSAGSPTRIFPACYNRFQLR